MNLELKKELNRIFDSVANRDYYSVVKEFFELCAISIRNSVDHENAVKYVMEHFDDVYNGEDVF